MACAISGFPIEIGDPVRIYLVSQNPFSEHLSSCGEWAPRTYPLRGRYNDYGGVNKVQEGPEREVWLEGLSLDVIPTDWGRGGFDKPITKKLTWDEMKQAIHENRLRVRFGVDDPRFADADKALDELCQRFPDLKKSFDEKVPSTKPKLIPRGIPTRARITKIVEKAGFKLKRDSGDEGYMVSKRRHGEVHVQFARVVIDDPTELEKLLPHLTGYATMISAGDPRSQFKPELIIRPKPGVEHYDQDKYRTLSVSNALVREDVWQALLKIPSPRPLQTYYDAAEHYPNTLARALGGQDHFLGMIGLGAHWYLLERRGAITKGFLRTAAEFAFIQRMLWDTQQLWRPSWTSGQPPHSWNHHRNFLKALTKVAEKPQHKDNPCARS